MKPDLDSESSGDEGENLTETNVILGYASKESAGDGNNHLGGFPTWLDTDTAPPASLAKCCVCNDLMSLLLQLNGDLPEHFPEDERRLYVFMCRRKQCRRKAGSIIVFRAVKKHRAVISQKTHSQISPSSNATKMEDLGSQLFGARTSLNSPTSNPFAQPSSHISNENPFSLSATLAAKSPQTTVEESLSSKLSYNLNISTAKAHDEAERPASEPWPSESSFPKPLTHLFLESDYEYSTPEAKELPKDTSSKVQYEEEGSAGPKDQDRDIFESTMDRTFMKFSDRLAQNPEQVIRYEYKGAPLLYSDSDEVGKLLSPSSIRVRSAIGMPNCESCGSTRVFEVQLVPGAIEAVEDNEVALEDGMDWGTIIVGVCSRNCGALGRITFRREWCGIQWE